MENLFEQAHKKREAQQAEIKKSCGMKDVTVPSKRKVRLDVTVPSATKDKLTKYSEENGLSASVVVQMAIEKFCK